MKRNNGSAPVRAIHADHIRVLNWGGELKVLDAKGNTVPGIIGCDVSMRPGVPPLMRLNLAAGNFDADGLPVFGMLDPRENRFRPIARVVFADGPDDFVPVTAQKAAYSPSAEPPAAEQPGSTESAPEGPHAD